MNDETKDMIKDTEEQTDEVMEETVEVSESSTEVDETVIEEEATVEDTVQNNSELEGKLEEAENRYLRLYADFENFRRRSQLEREAGEKYRAQSLITNLLPAIDNFERAMQIEPDNEQAKALLKELKWCIEALSKHLKQEGAEQIEAVGQEFDPNLHQAVMQTEDEEYGSNIVVEEFQKGYKLKDRVIRPSMVKVNK